MSGKKSALGRGLGALIEDANELKRPEPVKNEALNEVPIAYIEANPFQPRSEFDEDALNELAESIRQMGIIQPVTLRKLSDTRYQLISGERRFRASQIVGLERIPAYIRTADDKGMLEMALVENIQRQDLDAIEIAISYQRLIDECNLTQEEMSDRVGKKRATVSNYLRLLKLPAEIQIGIRKGVVSMGHARALITVEDPNDQRYIFEQILNDELSVRKVEEMVRKIKEPVTPATKPEKKENGSSDYTDLQKHLAKTFNSKVQFKRSHEGDGKIIIPFASDEELEHIIGILDKLNS